MTKDNQTDLTRRRFFKTSTASLAAPAAWAAGASGVLASQATAAGPRPSPKPVKIGIVGGRFGATFQWHLHPHCKVTAVCDLQSDRLKTLAEVYRCNNTYLQFREFLKHPELDAVGVFTPAPLHAWMATEAMKAGKHVISAVPAGLSVEEMEQLLESVKRTGMKYMMAETTYYRPQIITCRKWAQEGKFGKIYYSESEYHHNIAHLMYDERGFPTWRHGFPPMFYITHQTSAIIPVTEERLIEVQANGWGDDHEILRANRYQNPFWNTTGFFKTSKGHSCRISVFWRVPAGFAQRAQFYGEHLSYVMGRRPENHTDTVMRFAEESEAVVHGRRYPETEVAVERYEASESDHWETLPEPLRVPSGHAGSHTHLTHEFVSAILEDRHPAVDAWESVAYTIPGLMAHQSALKKGEVVKIKDYGKAPA